MHPCEWRTKDPGWSDWRWQLRHALRDADVLATWLGLLPAAREGLRRTAARYPLLATPYYLSLARTPSPEDPIVRQILPDPRELAEDPGGSPDPLAEGRDSPVPGLIHRYPDRALLVTTHRCAVLCRHCLRKRAWAATDDAGPWPTDFGAALDYLRGHEGIREVLISGGDPLLLPEERLLALLAALRAIPHIEVLRLGSRLPVVLPQRLTPEFCQRLGGRPPLWLATQFNHPHELTAETEAAAEALLRAGIPVVNQTVLLAGVNDDAATLGRLFTGLLRQRIKPYYLFHGDPVAGTLHFRTGIERGLALLAELERDISGLAVPAFAFDLPDGGGKVRLEPARRCGATGDGAPLYRDRFGAPRAYPEP
jgi:lysine 2,3-aminomutase